ncbi:hypothetical protein ACLKA6_017224 [Drosophila palustris]
MSSAKKSLQALKHVKSSMEVEAREEISRSIRSSLRQSSIDKRRLVNHKDSDESDSSSADIMNSTMKHTQLGYADLAAGEMALFDHQVLSSAPPLAGLAPLLAVQCFSSCCVHNISEASTTFGSATILHMYMYIQPTVICYN